MATSTIQPFIPQQFLLDDTSPNNGGSLEFYSAGTTTPKNVYTDNAQSNPASTKTLNAFGRVDGGIWWGSGAYKVIVKDSSGVQIGDPFDNVVAIGDGTGYWTQDGTRIYYSTGKVAIGTTGEQTEGFYVAGTTRLVGDTALDGDLIFGDIQMEYTSTGSGGTENNSLDVSLDSDYVASFGVKSNDTGLNMFKVIMDGQTTIGNSTDYSGLYCNGRGTFINKDASGEPVLLLDQNDTSEEMIEFNVPSFGENQTIEDAVESGRELTTTHFLKVKLTDGGLVRYIPMGTLA